MIKKILIDAIYLLALINPVSKISILSVFSSEEDDKEIIPVAAQSSLIALCILLLIMIFGNFILSQIFHVELYSLNIAGGIVLFWVGFSALTKGVFFEHGTKAHFRDISIVPLASPMIAGPATITASLTLSVQNGLFLSSIAMTIAIAINMGLMFISRPIGNFLSKFNILGALIRITGLIVITIGVQMVFNGLSSWIIIFLK